MLRTIATALLTPLLLSGAFASRAHAETPPTNPRGVLDASRWALEELDLEDGRTLKGLVDTENDKQVRFVEIQRPVGKPMYLVTRPIPRGEIKQLRKLSTEEHEVLAQRIDTFISSADEPPGEDLTLELIQRDGVDLQHFEGEWFVLDSTADEETTRRCIVRVEQVFAAYRRILPPRHTPSSLPRFLLFGSTGEYRAFLKTSKIELQNPAIFDPDHNLVVAGSELSSYAQRLTEARKQGERVLRQYMDRDQQMPDVLTTLNQELTQQNVGPNERKKVLAAAQHNWTLELNKVTKQINVTRRKNDAMFNTVTQQMFARLYHEAFHAYLENYVYPHRQHDVPRWLNEGLAQIFESGRIEADTFRVDAPSETRLADLQNDLRGPQPLALADVLTADESAFLFAHPGGSASSGRQYLYSWGLAYYLTFRQPVLETKQLDQYVEPGARVLSPLVRFETLVGMPLADFDQRWREEMLKAKVRGK